MGIFPVSPSVIQRAMLHYTLSAPLAAQHEDLTAKHESAHKGETGVPIRLGTIPPVLIISKHKRVIEFKQSVLNNLTLWRQRCHIHHSDFQSKMS